MSRLPTRTDRQGVRADLLMKIGHVPEAREETERAIALTQNLRERELLRGRLRQMDQ